MPKRDFNTEIALRHGCSSVYLRHIFTTPFYKSTYGRLFQYFQPTNQSLFFFKAPSENKQLSEQLKTFKEIYCLSTITLKINPF